jgi:hypothetical protein
LMFNMVVLPFHSHLPFPIQPVHSQPYILIHLREWQMLSHKLQKNHLSIFLCMGWEETLKKTPATQAIQWQFECSVRPKPGIEAKLKVGLS